LICRGSSHPDADRNRAPPLQLHHHELERQAAHLVSDHGAVDRRTTAKKGHKINAELDEGYYLTGIKISDKELAAEPLTRHQSYGDWNFTVHPASLKHFERGP
jgi:hypothetical protein